MCQFSWHSVDITLTSICWHRIDVILISYWHHHAFPIWVLKVLENLLRGTHLVYGKWPHFKLHVCQPCMLKLNAVSFFFEALLVGYFRKHWSLVLVLAWVKTEAERFSERQSKSIRFEGKYLQSAQNFVSRWKIVTSRVCNPIYFQGFRW